MYYRTRTYLAGDWTGDQDLIQTLKKWNDSDYWGLTFSDAHDLMQSYDTSMSCSIKRSLEKRLDASKTFVLIVGEDTDSLTKGACRYCSHYSSYYAKCCKGYHVDHRSFIKYECEKAIKDGLKIVVIYNYAKVHKSFCPECIKNTGTHIPAKYIGSDGYYHWDYYGIKAAIMD